MIIKTLLALHGAPHFNILLDKPLNHKRRFIVLTAQAIEHEHQQNVKLALQGHLLYFLDCIPVLGGNLKARNTLFRKFLDDFPAGVLFTKLPAILFLHGNIVLVHLSNGRHPVQADNTLFDCLGDAACCIANRLKHLLCHIYSSLSG